MLPQPLTGRTDGVGRFQDEHEGASTTRPQIFRSVIFENKTKRKTVSYGKTTQTARLP